MKPLVSIITPCFNGEKFIDNYISNIIRQTYEAVEVIFINDGSTDRSEEMVLQKSEKIKEKNYSFIYCMQENGGIAKAINSGLKLVTGEYIMLLDMDDVLYPDAIKAKADFLSQHEDYAMVRNNGYYTFEKHPKRRWKFDSSRLDGEEKELFEDLLLIKTYNWPGSYMVRSKHLFMNYPDRNIYISRYGQNLQFMLPLSYFYKTGFISDCLMEYYIRSESLSHSREMSKVLQTINGYENNRKEIVNKMNIDSHEKGKYLRAIEKKYLTNGLRFSIRTNNRELFHKQYLKLKQNNWLELKEWCLNILYRVKYFSFVYRVYCHFIFIINKTVI